MLWLRLRISRLFVLVLVVIVCGCGQPVVVEGGGGNYCSLNEKILWTSNRGSPRPVTGIQLETFNVFSMDADGTDARRRESRNLSSTVSHHVKTL